MSEWIDRRREEQCQIHTTEVDFDWPETVIEIEIRHRASMWAIRPLEEKWADFFNTSAPEADDEE